MALLSSLTLLFALFMSLVTIGVVWRKRWARRVAMTVEVLCLAGAMLSLVLPIGSNHGPVSVLVNIALPVAVIVLLRGRREAFS